MAPLGDVTDIILLKMRDLPELTTDIAPIIDRELGRKASNCFILFVVVQFPPSFLRMRLEVMVVVGTEVSCSHSAEDRFSMNLATHLSGVSMFFLEITLESLFCIPFLLLKWFFFSIFGLAVGLSYIILLH